MDLIKGKYYRVKTMEELLECGELTGKDIWSALDGADMNFHVDGMKKYCNTQILCEEDCSRLYIKNEDDGSGYVGMNWTFVPWMLVPVGVTKKDLRKTIRNTRCL